MLPRHLGREAEALERIFDVFSARTAPRPKAKNPLPFFASKATGCTLFCIIPLSFVIMVNGHKTHSCVEEEEKKAFKNIAK